MTKYTIRQTLHGDEYIVTVNGRDIGSVWLVNGLWNVTIYGELDVRASSRFASRSLAISFLTEPHSF